MTLQPPYGTEEDDTETALSDVTFTAKPNRTPPQLVMTATGADDHTYTAIIVPASLVATD